MNRNTWLIVLAAALLLTGGGLFFWLRRPVGPAPATASTAAAPAPFSTTGQDNGFGEVIPILLTDSKAELARQYRLPYIKGFYEIPETDNSFGAAEGGHKAALPPFDLNQPLTGKSYLDLLLLRNTLYARNGYCFMNSTVRSYFDQQPWYRPVWEEGEYDEKTKVTRPAETLRVPLTKAEAAFAERLHTRELELLRQRVTQQGGYPMLGPDFVVNQREEPDYNGPRPAGQSFAPGMLPSLARNNFVIVPTREEQLFYIYDQNDYSYTPNFVTTDLILQLLHKHFTGILSDVEATRLLPVVQAMLGQGGTQAQALAGRCQQPQARDAAEWAAAYYTVGYNLLTGSTRPAAGAYAAAAANEVADANAALNKGSLFLLDSLYEYQALRPRGNYTRTDTTRRYFRAVKYLNTAPVFLDSDAGLLRAVALAQALAASPEATRGFRQFTQVLDVVAGREDNRSLTNLLALLRTTYASQTLDQLAASPATLARLRQQLDAAGTDRIRARPATAKAAVALARPTLLFTAGRYSFDAEILARLVNVLKPTPQAVPLRPFPKGLDVLAAFGNKTAEDVLLTHYQEARRWPAYPDSLRVVQRQFAGPQPWDENLYAKTMHALLGLGAPSPDPNPPYFARTPAWQRRNLSTALGGWTQLKHDLLLYAEQPSGAEMGGGGGGPPPPHHLGYVEPNLPFWERTLALLDYQQAALTRLHANTPHLDSLNRGIRRVVAQLHKLAAKEVAHQPLTYQEMDGLTTIGGEVERLTLETLDVPGLDRLPDRERYVALASDVYAFNGDVLEEAVGNADALFVIVEINGVPTLARGAIFSYYEFTSPTRLTDEEWQARLRRAPQPRPTWLRDLLAPVPALNKNSRANDKSPVMLMGR